MKYTLKDVRFATTVRVGKHEYNYAIAEKTQLQGGVLQSAELVYDTDEQLLSIKSEGNSTKLVGLTNIKEMTVAESGKALGNSSGAKKEK